ncbi:hypothetical protein [Nitrosophilus labii]|uniref:hypothetical protein n=1 Tax=Nitrosophilus labii TaxID=2706014 RepID=UPI00165717DF|nr:hypothetical protein [Nitrosophilus labii]
MVRVFFIFIFIIKLSYGDLLEDKIKSLVSEITYEKHYKLIKKIFQNREDYYLCENKVDMIKVIKNLKENGLLNLFFDSPKKNHITFETNSNPVLFMKIIEDNLRNLGYYYFMSDEIRYDENAFGWKISFVSEYTLDPEIFSQFLIKNGCEVLDIVREDESTWRYVINVDNARLNATKLLLNEKIRLKKPLNDYWLIVKEGKKISIASYGGNRWYPKVTIYDKNLHVLKIYKKKRKTDWLVFYLPANAYYIKISDIFTLSNIKYGLRVTLE